jgi:glycerol-3-phosphate acyltransferase PlsY
LPELMNFIAIIIFAYLLGSFPSAFVLGKLLYGLTIMREGSGNVGTLNFFRVTRAKIPALLVLGLDLLKGYLAVFLTSVYFGIEFLLPASMAVILGHMFPVWTRGKGGRGLATLAGIFLYLDPLVFVSWWLIFGILYFLKRKYILAGMIALVLVNVLTFIFFDIHLFLILSVNSLIVMLKYRLRIIQELQNRSA